MSLRSATRLGGLCLLAAASIAMLATPVWAAKPDLVIRGASSRGPDFALQGKTAKTSFVFTVKNLGKPDNPAPARAGRSVAAASLVHANVPFGLGDANTPPLEPGKQHVDAVPDVDGSDLSFDAPIGDYTSKVCADVDHQVTEANERNNCMSIPDHFFVVKPAWTGTLSGTATVGNVNEQFHSTNANLVFERPIPGATGVFEYEFAGPLTYRDEGSGGGCTYSGGDTQRFGPRGAQASSSIGFDYLGGHYNAGANVDGSFYSIRYSCGPFNKGTIPAPIAPNFLNTGNQQLPFAAKRISGGTSSQGQTWTWNFE